MELFVAIIWYLNLMAPNTAYTTAQVQSVVNNNPEVVTIANDQTKSADIWRQFDAGWEIEVQGDILEWWEEDTSCSYSLMGDRLPQENEISGKTVGSGDTKEEEKKEETPKEPEKKEEPKK
jgi:hypothetical protein